MRRDGVLIVGHFVIIHPESFVKVKETLAHFSLRILQYIILPDRYFVAWQVLNLLVFFFLFRVSKRLATH